MFEHLVNCECDLLCGRTGLATFGLCPGMLSLLIRLGLLFRSRAHRLTATDL